MASHIVKQGEHLSRIAHDHGFSNYGSIWHHPENAGLKQLRQDPNILFPGDRLFIPDREERIESVPTEQRHRFQLTGRGLKLRIALHNLAGDPVQGAHCQFIVEMDDTELATDGRGMVQKRIPPTAENGSLIIHETTARSPLHIPLQIGHLDPIDTESGQKARLNNLGYLAGDLEEVPSGDNDAQRLRLQFRSAVEEFQCDFNLTVDGICAENTQAKLKEVHGC